jgi:hypothetical protein
MLGRPRRQDSAITHVRVSRQTKAHYTYQILKVCIVVERRIELSSGLLVTDNQIKSILFSYFVVLNNVHN